MVEESPQMVLGVMAHLEEVVSSQRGEGELEEMLGVTGEEMLEVMAEEMLEMMAVGKLVLREAAVASMMGAAKEVAQKETWVVEMPLPPAEADWLKNWRD